MFLQLIILLSRQAAKRKRGITNAKAEFTNFMLLAMSGAQEEATENKLGNQLKIFINLLK